METPLSAKHLNDMLMNEDYLSILEHHLIKNIVVILDRAGLFSLEHQYDSIKIDDIASQLNLDVGELQSLIQALAATLLQLFVVSNFTGPKLDTASEYNNLIATIPIYNQLNRSITTKDLRIDYVDVYHLVDQPWLLFIVKRILSLLEKADKKDKNILFGYYVWSSRFLSIYSMVLLDPVESLLNKQRKLQDLIYSDFIFPLEENRYDTQEQLILGKILPGPVELCCEMVQSSLVRDDITMSKKFLGSAFKISGISIEATGILGKRTRFQRREVAQLVVRVDQKPKDPNICHITITDAEEVKKTNLPIDVKLDCDTLLPEIQFTSKDATGTSNQSDGGLSVESQVLLLSMLNVTSRSEAVDENLAAEYSAAYLHTIIKSSTVWSVSFKALVQRCNIEKKISRKIDRALLQMEELIKLTTAPDLSHKKFSDFFGRLRLFHSVLSQPVWCVQQNYGDISMDLGLYKNALEIFLKIELWEKAISCYQILNMNQKAETLIRRELEKRETPYLLCLLGDVTEDIESYEKAWILSNMRYARAKKSLGTYYYVRKEYDEAIEHYEMAIHVNPSNTSVLYMLAYSYLILEKFEEAAQCYRSITEFDDSSFLAWNNLSKAYIKLKQKVRAWRTLNEAIKCNFEEWRIWENFMLVSTDIGAFEDIMKSWHRLIDLKSSHEDDQVLEILTNALVNNLNDVHGDPSERLIKKALKLIARIHATSSSSPNVWICYYRLLMKDFQLDLCSSNDTPNNDSQTKKESSSSKKSELSLCSKSSQVDKIAHALQRAIPSKLTADRNWFCITEKVLTVLETYNKLADCHLEAYDTLSKHFNNNDNTSRSELKPLVTQMASFRMALSNICRTVSRQINETSNVVANSEIVLNSSAKTGVDDKSEISPSPAQRQQSLIDSLTDKKDSISKLVSSISISSPRI